jgi:aspartokinase
MSSVTRLSQKYIAEHPSIKDCLRKGIVNYSALSREICNHYQIERFDAVLIACRRLHRRVKAQEPLEKKILSLLKRAKIRLRNKMMVAIVEKPRDFERMLILQRQIKRDRGDFHLIEGEDSITIISNSEFSNDLKESFRGKILKLEDDLAQITMVFDAKIETTPGVVSFIYGLLADHEINVQEEMSCWTDLMMMISENDAARAMKVLSLRDDEGNPE